MTVLQMPFATTKGQRDSIVEELQAIVRTATAEDRDEADRIIAMAKDGKATVAVCSLQPAVCAILFLKSNDFNRQWKPAIVNEYARRMSGDSGNTTASQSASTAIPALATASIAWPLPRSPATHSRRRLRSGSIPMT